MSNNRLRSFVGLPIVNPVLGYLDSLASQLAAIDGNKMSWVPRENYHVTLLFLGEQTQQWLDDFANAVEEEIEFDSVEVNVSSVMPFPERSPKLFAAIIDESEALLDLHNDLKRIAKKLGYQPEKRRFKPHITLARNFMRSGKHLIPPRIDKMDILLSEFIIYALWFWFSR